MAALAADFAFIRPEDLPAVAFPILLGEAGAFSTSFAGKEISRRAYPLSVGCLSALKMG